MKARALTWLPQLGANVDLANGPYQAYLIALLECARDRLRERLKTKSLLYALELQAAHLLPKMLTGRHDPRWFIEVEIDKPGGRGKRSISTQPDLTDRILDFALTKAVQDCVERILLDCCIGFRPGKKICQELLEIPERLRAGEHVMVWDIRQCFPSVDEVRLKSMIGQLPLPRGLRKLIARLVLGRKVRDRSSRQGRLVPGLPPGLALCCPLLNFYLTPLDKQLLRNLPPGVAYWRYVDNLVFVGPFTELLKLERVISAILPRPMRVKDQLEKLVLGYRADSDGFHVPQNKIETWTEKARGWRQAGLKGLRGSILGYYGEICQGDEGVMDMLSWLDDLIGQLNDNGGHLFGEQVISQNQQTSPLREKLLKEESI